MTDSASSTMAIFFGLAVFALIVAVGWRSVQNRRILRMQGAKGQETIIIAGEDDDVSNVVATTTETTRSALAPGSAPSAVVGNKGIADPVAAQAPKFGHTPGKSNAAFDVEADVAGRDRLKRLVSSTK